MSATTDARVQFFAVRVEHVRDPDERRDMWFWFSDTMVPIEQGAFAVEDDGRLEFKADNRPEKSETA